MEQPMHHLLDDASLNLVVECLKGKVGGRAHDVESGFKVITSMGEDKSACVDKTKSKVEGSGGKGWGWKVEGQWFTRWVLSGSCPWP